MSQSAFVAYIFLVTLPVDKGILGELYLYMHI